MSNPFASLIRFVANFNLQYWEAVLMLLGDDPDGYGPIGGAS